MNQKSKVVLVFIMIIGILIRLFFIMKTNISQYQFDTGTYNISSEQDYDNLYENFDKDEEKKSRHINYIMLLYTTGTLPTKIVGQFYHPPLHHFIMANWLKIINNLLEVSSFKFESMQFVTLAYSLVILIALYKLLEEIGLKDKYKIVPMLLFAFYPLNIFMSGLINNDELVTMFAIVALLYLVKWSKNQTMFNTIVISLCIGLGLMTKSSMFVMIIPAVYIYFKTLNDFVNKDKSIKKLLIELLVFTVISSAIGLWFYVRALIKELNVFGIVTPYESLSIADMSIWSRFGIPNFLVMSGVNIWNYFIYSSLNFGLMLEHDIYIKIMAIISIILFMYSICSSLKNCKDNSLIFITAITWWGFYFYLNIVMPYTCSMHPRYMLVPISVGITFIGIGLQNEKNKIIRIIVSSLTIILSIMSIIMFAIVI